MKPMLCKNGNLDILDSDEYYFEPKLDGTRALLVKRGKAIKLINRRNRDITYRYPEFKNISKFIKIKECILDGEIICYNKKGLPDFNLLQRREQLDNPFEIELRSIDFPATYVAFDILNKNGKDLSTQPIEKRKKLLSKLIIENKNLQIIFYTEKGKKLWEKITSLNLEGVIAKKKGSLYYKGKRTDIWLKIKYLKTADCVIVGYTTEKRVISALALAVYKSKRLLYIGKVGTGFSQQFLIELYKKLKRIKTTKRIVTNPQSNIIWVLPKYVCTVKYLDLTSCYELRAPSFKKLRDDKLPTECTFEQFKNV